MHVPIVLKFWEPQPPGTLRSCTGVVLPFTLGKFQQMHTKRGRTIGGFRPPTNLHSSGNDRTVRRPKKTILLKVKATIYGQCDIFLVNRETRQPMTVPHIQIWIFAEIRRVMVWVLSGRTHVTVLWRPARHRLTKFVNSPAFQQSVSLLNLNSSPVSAYDMAYIR